MMVILSLVENVPEPPLRKKVKLLPTFTLSRLNTVLVVPSWLKLPPDICGKIVLFTACSAET